MLLSLGCRRDEAAPQDLSGAKPLSISEFVVRHHLGAELGCDERVRITWSLDKVPAEASSGAAKRDLETQIERALREWADAAGPRLRFEASPPGKAFLRFSFADGELAPEESRDLVHEGRELARTELLQPELGPSAGFRIVFCGVTHWDFGGSDSSGLSFFPVVLHEVGHVLGLDHVLDPEAIMHPSYRADAERLGASDRDGIRTLYGDGRAVPGDLVVEFGGEGPSKPLVVAGAARHPGARWSLISQAPSAESASEAARWNLMRFNEQVTPPRWTSYRVDERRRLVAGDRLRLGPWSPGDRLLLHRDRANGVILIKLGEAGRYAALEFDAEDRDFKPCGSGSRMWTLEGARDEAGDGRLTLVRDRSFSREIRVGDLDGDGHLDRIRPAF